MLTILFDLDDTLLNNNSEEFTKVYLGLLGNHLASKISPKVMIPALLEGTRQMVEKTTIAGTLEETFDKSFYPAIGISKEELEYLISDFYKNKFPALQPQTSPKPGAVEIVNECFARGWKVAVATNPLFPMAAVRHRLTWAGLNPDKFPFSDITAYETYHFAKPQPAYFAEVSARTGSFDNPIVMVGNDLTDDILPAANAGLPVFWLSSSNNLLPDSLPIGSKQGLMPEILPWLDNIEKTRTSAEPKTISAILTALNGGAAAIDSIGRRLSPEQWNIKISDKDWNITEILCHLRDVDKDVNLPRIQKIQLEQQPFIVGIETDLWADERDYIHQNGKEALKSFLFYRQELTRTLQNLPPEIWKKQFRHSIFGPSTLKEIMGFSVSHDNNHIRQIFNLLN